jgi:hypothetical protein
VFDRTELPSSAVHLGLFCCEANIQTSLISTFLDHHIRQYFLSAFISFILYTAVLLRVRGHLIKDDQNRWRLQLFGRGNEWKLPLTRDVVDDTMLRVVQMMVWQVTSSSYCNALIEVFVAGIQ